MVTNIRAELVKQVRRPAVWLLLAVAVSLSLTFGYLIPYTGYTGTASGAPGSDRGLAAMLPESFVGSAVGGLPVFAGALALIFGVLVAGSEYGWQTWKTVLAQRPARLTVYAAKLVTAAAGTLAGVLTLLAAAAVASAAVAAVEDAPLDWPGPADLALGVGGAWLIALMWAALGVALAIALRAVALPIGLGLVWLLAAQNLLASIAAPLIDWIAEAQKILPGPNAGAMAAALGAADAPGVDPIVSSGHAAIVMAAYLLAFCVAGGWLLRSRDIT
ncbi:ABC transporter permease [Allosalinactinospora lopnorensis]|uniref:ABC transporter permease n=1 Tax=Allosalinactinospora lopnorensis TaxID=1352348 RepID=UPI000623D624|nr:ABC transporter permease [Allosalinactinospora lopnorensis]